MQKNRFYSFVCLIFLLCSFLAKGQNETDSLKSMLVLANEDSTIAHLNLEIGESLINASPEQAMPYYQSAKVLCEELNDTSTLIQCLLGICDVHSTFDENKDAINAIYQALELATNNNELLALCYNRLSLIYYQLDNLEKSLESDLQSLKYNRLLNDSSGIAYDFHNIGTYFMENEQLDSALYYYQNSNFTAPPSDITLPIYNTSRMGLIYFKKKQYKQAIEQQLKAIEAFKENDMQVSMAHEQGYLAQSYFELKDYNNSEKYTRQSLKLAQELSHTGLFIGNYTMLMDLSRTKKDFKKALNYSLLVNSYSDSIATKNNATLLQSIEAKQKYATQKRLLKVSEAKNEFLLHQKRLYSILAILAFLTFIIGSAFIFILLRNRRVTKKLVDELNFANKSKSKLLSLTGHDLRNSIGTLKGFTDLLASKDISEADMQQLMPKFVAAVDSSYDLLDNLVTWGSRNREGLTQNIQVLNSKQLIERTQKHVQQLAKLKNISLETNNADFDFKGDNNMVLTVIRNLVSNAIKFSPADTTITIHAFKKEDCIEFKIKDQGVGISDEDITKILDPKIEFNSKGTENESGSGLGINICQSFIKGHGGELSIDSQLNQGSTFTFTIIES